MVNQTIIKWKDNQFIISWFGRESNNRKNTELQWLVCHVNRWACTIRIIWRDAPGKRRRSDGYSETIQLDLQKCDHEFSNGRGEVKKCRLLSEIKIVEQKLWVYPDLFGIDFSIFHCVRCYVLDAGLYVICSGRERRRRSHNVHNHFVNCSYCRGNSRWNINNLFRRIQ